ncbi:MAG TPA: PP2C family protein-serine/threonine phosphatase [Candidatus Limnocylindrales bacterium]|nr:PP2C family protein-serine/threonine phosphatase [Candidatus Limnocylindrales bacterium]
MPRWRRSGEAEPTAGDERERLDRFDRELRAAQRIQRVLVGLTETHLGEFDLAWDYEPAREIGGDFLDAFTILEPDGRPSRRLGLVIADVTGKGISAALLMAFVRPIVRTAMDRSGSPIEALERTNAILATERQTGLFVTVLCGIVDLGTGEVVLGNAGHERPILVPADGSEPRWIEGGGPLVGAFPKLDLEPIRLRLGLGDRLLTYTDGVIDATSPVGERFGEARLLQAVRGSGPTPDDLVDAITSAVSAFRGAAEPADDLALLAVGRQG